MASNLRGALYRHYTTSKNKWGQEFLCLGIIKGIITREMIEARTKTHSLRRSPDSSFKDSQLTDKILDSPLLFAVLVLAELEFLTEELLFHHINVERLVEMDHNGLSLKADEEERLQKYCKLVAPVFRADRHKIIHLGGVLPFKEYKATPMAGSFGAIYEIEVADGHLENFDAV